MSLKEIWENPGPDQGYSWVVLLASFVTNLIVLGFIRCQGNIFLGILRSLSVSREEASYPVTTYMVMLHFAGLFSGPANYYFTSRQIILVATSTASLGLCLAYVLPQSVLWICLSYGVVTGFSVGFIFPSELQVLSAYFNKHRSKAQNALAAGFTCGGLLYPFLIESVLETFALKGTWLIACGLLLQSFIFSLLMRPRTAKQFPILAKSREELVPQSIALTVENELKTLSIHNVYRETLSIQSENEKSSVIPERESLLDPKIQQNIKIVPTQKNPQLKNGNVGVSCDTEIAKTRDNEESFMSLLKELIRTPTFYAVTLSYVIDIAAFFAMIVTIVDHGRDCGLDNYEATMLVPTLSLGELVSRSFSGYITDSMILSPHKQMAFGSLASCVIYIALTLSNGYFLYAIVLAIGVAFCITSGARLYMTTNILGTKNGATVCGVGNFGIGCAVIFVPKLIGIFRDNHGSYYYLFLLLSGAYVLLALIMFVDEYISKRFYNKQIK